jgi:hypothetical protein
MAGLAAGPAAKTKLFGVQWPSGGPVYHRGLDFLAGLRIDEDHAALGWREPGVPHAARLTGTGRTELPRSVSVFLDRNRGGSYLVVLIAGAGIYSMLYFVTYFDQQVMHLDAIKTGFSLVSVSLIIAGASQAMPRLIPPSACGRGHGAGGCSSAGD